MAAVKEAKTLIDFLQIGKEPSSLRESTLLIIDAQKEYTEGALPLTDVEAAIGQIEKLLKRARSLNSRIVHVKHMAPSGAPIFNPEGKMVEIVDKLKPIEGEPVVEKHFPNSFTESSLAEELYGLGSKKLIIVGFMSHMCVSATARAGMDRGFEVTVVDSACATRDLPDGAGGVVPAQSVHRANIAALADLVATIAKDEKAIAD